MKRKNFPGYSSNLEGFRLDERMRFLDNLGKLDILFLYVQAYGFTTHGGAL